MKKLPLLIPRLSIGGCFLAAVCLLVIALLQMGILSVVENSTKTRQGNITVTGWGYEKWGDIVVMKVDCEGKEGRVRYGKDIAVYLQNPRKPLYGTLYASGRVRLQTSKE